MKKILVFVAFLLISAISAVAQKVTSAPETTGDKQLAELEEVRLIREKGITTRMAYCDYEKLYDSHKYVHMPGDPYSPAGAGIASFFIPGLGQIINGQAGKGCGMLFGRVALVIGSFAMGYFCAEEIKDEQGKVISRKTTPVGTAGMIIGLSGAVAINVWSICDAVHVAKIKNLYYRDCMLLSSSFDVNLMPSLSFATTAQGVQPAPGLTLAIKF